MTKSRTLRKAGAVVLSLAMAFSVASIPASAAAKKPKLKATTATVKVKQSKTVKVVKNGTKIVKITVSSKDKAIATAKASGKTGVKVTGKAAGTVKVVAKITYKYKGKKKSVKKTLKVTVKPNTTTDEDNTKVILDKITIAPKEALQSDNTALVGDTLKASIDAELGVFQDIVWTCNGKSKNTSGAYGTGGSTGNPLEKTTDEKGEWQLKAVTSKGTTYLSNKVTVTDQVAPVVIENFAVEEVYDDTNDPADGKAGDEIVYADKTKKLVGHFTVNRIYEFSTFGICEADKATKEWSNANDAYTFSTKAATYGGKAVPATKVDDKATAASVVNKNIMVTTAGKGYKAEVFIGLNDTDCVRGTSYVGIVDQDKIDKDKIGKGAENMSAPTAAPYLKAPTSFVVTTFESSQKAVSELRDADGKALDWLYAAASTGAKIAIKTMNKKGNEAATTDSLDDKSADSKIEKGVVTTTGTFGERFFYAKAILDAKVWGAEEVTLTSNVIEKAAAPATKMELDEDGATPTSATVKFENLATRASGTVYVWQSTASADQALGLTIPKNAASASVVGGSTSVTVAGVYDKKNVGVANDKQYVAVFVPESVGEYTKMSAVFSLDKKFAKFKTGSINVYATTGEAVEAKDQFGEGIVTADVRALFMKYSKDDPTMTLTNKSNGTTATLTVNAVAATGTPTDYYGGAAHTNISMTVTQKGTYEFTTTTGQTVKLEVTADNKAIGKLSFS